MASLSMFLCGIVIGYLFFLHLSHPKKSKSKLPAIKYKYIEILPSLKIHTKNYSYWIHHWIYLSVLIVVSLFVFEALAQLVLLKGVAIGGIIQGLGYEDRFRIRTPRKAIEF